jgi:hypothetical protein
VGDADRVCFSMEVGMGSTVAVRVRILIVALALTGVACGGGGSDDTECGTCRVSEDCHGSQECVQAVDGNLRCFDPDDATCTLGRVKVGRAPTPVPTATP